MNEMTLMLARLGILLVAAHGAGYLVFKYLKLPRVLGEMLVGILLGQQFFGRFNILFGHQLFTNEIIDYPLFHIIINIATMILLFNAGMHTDIRFFFRFFMKGSLVGLSGVLVSFVAAAWITAYFIDGVDSILDPVAIFMGIATSTSVGISARILSEKNKLNSLEGNVSITAAVLDDVLGIILLSVATAIAISSTSGEINIPHLVFVAAREILYWILLTIFGIVISKLIAKYFRRLSPYVAISMSAIGFVFIMGGLAESLGLSAVIGAYAIGLGFGNIDTSGIIEERVSDLAGFFVPVFFAITGLQIDFSAMGKGIIFSLAYALGSLLFKVLGAGSMAGLLGFNRKGMLRIGLTMLPRGEVTLVIANIGLGLGVLNSELFDTLAFTVFLSVLFTPFLLLYAYKDDAMGYRKKIDMGEKIESFEIETYSEISQSFLFGKIYDAFESARYFIHTIDNHRQYIQFRKKQISVLMKKKDQTKIFISTELANLQLVKFIILEEIVDMQNSLKDIQKIAEESMKDLEQNLMTGLITENK